MDQNLEQLLQEQPLRQPGAELDQRILDALAHEPLRLNAHQPAQPRWRRLAAAAVILAALTGLSIWARGQRSPATSGKLAGTNIPLPAPSVHDDNTLRYQQIDTQWVDAGVIDTAEYGPVRILRQQTVQQVWVFDEANDRTAQMTEPREQVVYVPVKLQ